MKPIAQRGVVLWNVASLELNSTATYSELELSGRSYKWSDQSFPRFRQRIKRRRGMPPGSLRGRRRMLTGMPVAHIDSQQDTIIYGYTKIYISSNHAFSSSVYKSYLVQMFPSFKKSLVQYSKLTIIILHNILIKYDLLWWRC